MEIGKIYIRSIVGIIVAGIATVLVGNIVDPQVMAAFYLSLGAYIYLDKKVSGDIND